MRVHKLSAFSFLATRQSITVAITARYFFSPPRQGRRCPRRLAPRAPWRVRTASRAPPRLRQGSSRHKPAAERRGGKSELLAGIVQVPRRVPVLPNSPHRVPPPPQFLSLSLSLSHINTHTHTHTLHAIHAPHVTLRLATARRTAAAAEQQPASPTRMSRLVDDEADDDDKGADGNGDGAAAAHARSAPRPASTSPSPLTLPGGARLPTLPPPPLLLPLLPPLLPLVSPRPWACGAAMAENGGSRRRAASSAAATRCAAPLSCACFLPLNDPSPLVELVELEVIEAAGPSLRALCALTVAAAGRGVGCGSKGGRRTAVMSPTKRVVGRQPLDPA